MRTILIFSAVVLVVHFAMDKSDIDPFWLHLPGVAYGGINHQHEATRLFSAPDGRLDPVAYLQPGEFASYLYSGEEGAFHYIRHNDKTLNVHHSRITLGYVQLFDRWVVTEQAVTWAIKSVLSLALVLGLFFLKLAFVSVKNRRKKKLYNYRPESRRPQPMVSESESQATITKTTQPFRDAPEQERMVSESAMRALLSEQEKRHRAELAEKERRHQVEIARKVAEVKEQARIEVDKMEKRVYTASLASMRESLAELNALYEKTIRDGRVFDVDFKHEKFENMLKGRKFEICMADYFEKKLGMTIVNWSPDKGLLNGNWVESNLHPDLLLRSKSGELFAVECKYRGQIVKRCEEAWHEDCVEWASTSQAIRYSVHSKENGLPVWVAIGLQGDASSPQQIFMAQIESLFARSSERERIYIENGEKKKKLMRITTVSAMQSWLFDLTRTPEESVFFPVATRNEPEMVSDL